MDDHTLAQAVKDQIKTHRNLGNRSIAGALGQPIEAVSRLLPRLERQRQLHLDRPLAPANRST